MVVAVGTSHLDQERRGNGQFGRSLRPAACGSAVDDVYAAAHADVHDGATHDHIVAARDRVIGHMPQHARTEFYRASPAAQQMMVRKYAQARADHARSLADRLARLAVR